MTDWSRVARAAALAAWGAFFIFLLASGRATTYIGPKTAWVVTVGALALPLIALVLLAGARRRARTPAPRELGGLLVLVLPILLAIMVPAPSLGALAVANKRGHSAVPQGAPVHGRLRLYEIAWASQDRGYAAANHIGPGAPVDFAGFVSSPTDASDFVALSRFFITCCAADATADTVSVKVPPGTRRLKNDTWVRVRGSLALQSGLLIVQATTIDRIPKPGNPYQ